MAVGISGDPAVAHGLEGMPHRGLNHVATCFWGYYAMSGMGAAAGAGIGGKVQFELCCRKACPKCQGDGGCEQVKSCMQGCANKAFMMGAMAAGVGSVAGGVVRAVRGHGGPIDEWTAGPFFGTLSELQGALAAPRPEGPKEELLLRPGHGRRPRRQALRRPLEGFL
mmetsp:Transcript_51321/g.159078  ORF Transcript_51321/g.159078 Transcript_51321/m.159078 type:complete len:167 (+) Transcript_51321:85-585(+)